MNNTLNTIKLIFKASIGSFISVIIYASFANAFLFGRLFLISPESTINPLVTQYFIYIFFGLIIGNSVHRLQSTYLYSHLKQYRNTIIISSLSIITVLALPSYFVLNYFDYSLLTALFFGFCVTFCTAQIFINKKPFLFIISIFALFIIIIPSLQPLPFRYLMLGFILLTIVLIYFTFKKNLDIKHNKTIKKESYHNVAESIQLNYVINLYTIKLIELLPKNLINTCKSGELKVLLFNPISRFNLFIIIPFVLLLSLSDLRLNNISGISLLALISIYLLITLNFSNYATIKNLTHQLKPISHLYAKDKHKPLKKLILQKLDIKLLSDSLIIITFNFLIMTVLSVENNHLKLILLLLSIILTILAFTPLLLRKITKNKIIQLFIFIPITSLLLINIFWIVNHSVNELISIEVALYIALLIGIRIFGNMCWRNYSIEELVKQD
ncbi:MAG: hypothetical protein HRU38_06630 [Saccharospirillaceae bacterium]|nr:hypothetical protein [Pseudomonadales bacterium]NRB78329.1 hypothetical protein [Saccharospirillaceae bacterium]